MKPRAWVIFSPTLKNEKTTGLPIAPGIIVQVFAEDDTIILSRVLHRKEVYRYSHNVKLISN